MSIVDPRPWLGLAALVAALALGGCLDTGTSVTTSGSVTAEAGMKHSELSPRGAAVAFASLDGPSQAVSDRFLRDVAAAADDRQITVADLKSARYVLRGYLTAYRTDDGAALQSVWDVFGPGRQRTQRVADAVVVKGTADDPWTLVDDTALQNIAAKSADDLAMFLAATPEAAAAALPPSKVAEATAPVPPAIASGAAPTPDGTQLSYAPAE